MDNLQRMYKEVAESLGINKYEVEDVFKSQLFFASKVISSKEERAVRLPKLGTVRPKIESIRKYKEKIENGRKTQQD